MKHNFSFLPSLRRTTLLALLCLGIMPVLAETVYTIKFMGKDAQRSLCMKDMGDGVVKYIKDDNTDASKWRKVPANETVTFNGSSYDVYYLQNVSTGKYLYASEPYRDGGNGDWWYYVTMTGNKSNNDLYKWFFMPKDGNWVIFSKPGINDGGKDKSYSHHLHSANQYNDCTDTYAAKPLIPCGRSGDINAYAQVAMVESTITASYTFPAGSVWYLDMRTITSNNANFLVDFGDKYSVTQTISGSATKSSGNSGEFQNCNKPFLQITFSADAVVDENKQIFKCSQGGWAEVKNNFPAAGQNMMVVSADGKSITWDTYVPGPTCTDCGLVNAKQ